MFSSDIEAVRGAISRAPHNAVVLIDGPSGSGKSTVADILVDNWPTNAVPQLVRLDDIYPGWSGLESGAAHVRQKLLAPRAAGSPAGWRRWSWASRAPAEWHALDAQQPVVVEGCGAFSGDGGVTATDLADIAVWVSADDTTRKSRALERDAGGFDAHWDEWQAQWERYERRENPRKRATMGVCVD